MLQLLPDGNHYHLLIETPKANLSQGMRQLNGVYTQYFNHSHKRVGHLFQGRFKAVIVQKDAYLLELIRYIVLNPVRAKIAKNAQNYAWSSYHATIGLKNKPALLNVLWVLSQFNKTREKAIKEFTEFVNEKDVAKPWDSLKGQIYLGKEVFIENLEKNTPSPCEVPRSQRQPVRPALSELLSESDGIVTAYRKYGYKLKEIAEIMNVHYATISRKMRKMEGRSINVCLQDLTLTKGFAKG